MRARFLIFSFSRIAHSPVRRFLSRHHALQAERPPRVRHHRRRARQLERVQRGAHIHQQLVSSVH